MNERRKRRYKLAFVGRDTLLLVFDGRFPQSWHDRYDLPEDARVVNVHDAWMRDGLEVVIHSASFDVVPEGEEPPWLEPVGDRATVRR